MALDDFFKRQREEQEQKKEAERALYEKQRREREAKEEFEKKLPDFFKTVVDAAIQTVIDRFQKEHLEGIYAQIGRRFRAARPSQRIDRDFYVDFHRNAVQFHIFPRNDSFHIAVEVSTDPRMTELKTVDTNMDYPIEEFTEEALLDVVGTALENIENLTRKDKDKNKDSGVIKL